MVEDLDGTRNALMIRAMDEESGETARLNEPHAGDLSKGPAVTSLVLGILAFVIQLLAWGDWFIRDRQQDAAFERFLAGTGPNPESPDPVGLLIWSPVSLAVGISAIVFGVKGRKLAKAEARSRGHGQRRVGSRDRLRGDPDPGTTCGDQLAQLLPRQPLGNCADALDSEAGSWPEGVRTLAEPALELVGPHRRSLFPSSDSRSMTVA
jgi:hypothetical protein